jgi:hypothetical protein
MCGGGVLKPCGKCSKCEQCPPGSPGSPGASGASAYDIWIQEGNVGTEQDFLDSLVGPAGPSGGEQVFYSEQALGVSSVGTSPTKTTIAGTSYTVPAAADGDYRVTYTVDLNLGDGASDVSYAVFVNSVQYGTIERQGVSSDIEIQGSALVLSDITLAQGDVIDIRGESNDPTSHYPINGVCLIEKIS